MQLQEVESATGETLSIVESVDVKRGAKTLKRLAVGKDSAGNYVLCRERERGAIGADGKRSTENGIERDWRRSCKLEDFKDAILSGLIAV